MGSETWSPVAVTDPRLMSGAVAGVTDTDYSAGLGKTFRVEPHNEEQAARTPATLNGL